eukprot:evm.model.scf_3059.2 EVM.evm.TU.scf_3059.2   scf_3059:10782-14904(-)
MRSRGALAASLCLCLWACAIPWTHAQTVVMGPFTVVATDTTPGTVGFQVPLPNATQPGALAPADAAAPQANISMNGSAVDVNMTGGASVDTDLDAEIMSNAMGDGQTGALAPGAQPSLAANSTAPDAASPASAPQATQAMGIARSPLAAPAPVASAPGPAAFGPSAGGPSAAPGPNGAPGPAVALPPGALLVAQGPLSQMQVEAAETTLEVQMAIEAGNATEAAEVFIQTDSVEGVADGLRIAPDAEELPVDVPLQEKDPDVVAVKGVAIAVLQAADTDPELIERLADAIIASVLPKPARRFCTTGAPNMTDWWYVHVGGTRRDWTRGSDAKCLGSITKNPVGWGEEPCVSGSTKRECEDALTKAVAICEPIVKAIVELGVNDDPEFCGIIDNAYKYVNRTVLLQKLEDRELMMRVQELDPSQAATTPEGRKLLFAGGLRSLLVSSGRNVDSLYCARCWPKEVCEESFAFCKPEPKKKKCKKGKKGKQCRQKNKKSKKDG